MALSEVAQKYRIFKCSLGTLFRTSRSAGLLGYPFLTRRQAQAEGEAGGWRLEHSRFGRLFSCSHVPPGGECKEDLASQPQVPGCVLSEEKGIWKEKVGS